MQQQQQQTNSLFGPKPGVSSLFAPKPATSSAFPFSNPATSNTSNSLFSKPFGSTATTNAAGTTSTLFGNQSTSTNAAQQPSSTTPAFGNTLSSSSSGTLFGGTASKQPFFGK
jgi:hypothetical protein